MYVCVCVCGMCVCVCVCVCVFVCLFADKVGAKTERKKQFCDMRLNNKHKRTQFHYCSKKTSFDYDGYKMHI